MTSEAGSPDRRFDDVVAVVTGASSGIGRRVALDLAARGATVTAVARRQDLLAEVEEEMRSQSAASSSRVCDVGDVTAYEALLAEIEGERGRIDVLINNAAIEQPTGATDGFTDVYRRIMDINYF